MRKRRRVRKLKKNLKYCLSKKIALRVKRNPKTKTKAKATILVFA